MATSYVTPEGGPGYRVYAPGPSKIPRGVAIVPPAIQTSRVLSLLVAGGRKVQLTGRCVSWACALVLSSSLKFCGARHMHEPGQQGSAGPTQARDPLDQGVESSTEAGANPSVAPPELQTLPGSSPACPSEMVLVDGSSCPEVRQTCRRWLDPPGPYHDYRCAEYAPSECLAPRVHRRFCIDREEYVEPGDTLPLAHQSWTSAGAVCAGRGARLCVESEWQFACEGESILPYPYGLSRDDTACNIDRTNLGKPQSGLNDLRAPTDAFPRCLSPFFVHDMSGNVEEWATIENGRAPDRSVMKGAWWLPGRNTCRAATLGHGEGYEGPQVGVRCCKDAAP
jgi:formylglycine-generating enzyme